MECYCGDECPPHALNSTCITSAGGWCFAVASERYDPDSGRLVAHITRGCLRQQSGDIQCQGTRVEHAIPTSIECCRDGAWCNRQLTPTYLSLQPSNYSLTSHYGVSMIVALAVSVVVILISLVAILTVLYFRYRGGNRDKKMITDECDVLGMEVSRSGLMSSPRGRHCNRETSSASGSGQPLLCQRTIAREVALCECVGRGRYGLVYSAVYQGTPVAVKMFFSLDETSWRREKFIYETCRLQHPNVLGFIAADITSRADGGSTCTEMWLITEYHRRGSLYDCLSSTDFTLTDKQTLRMALSIVQGLDYLHQEVVSTGIRPAVAHRDIKSKNVLVKADGECCLADLGLALVCSQPVVKSSATPLIQSSHTASLHQQRSNELAACMFVDQSATRQGTRRYMSPELLALQQPFTGDISATITPADVSFQTFKQADIYALALVLWELCLRCCTEFSGQCDTPAQSCETITLTCDPYRVPYAEFVDLDPTVTQMYECVFTRQLRPPISPRWMTSPILSCMARLMQECWRHSAASRLSAMYIKKRLLILAEQ